MKTKTSLILEYPQTKEDSRHGWTALEANKFRVTLLPKLILLVHFASNFGFIILKSSEFLVQCEWQFYFIFISPLNTIWNLCPPLCTVSSFLFGCCICTVSVLYLNFLLMVLTKNNMLFVCCRIKFEAWSYMLVC